MSLNNNALATNNRLRSLLFSDVQNLTLKSNSKVQVEANRDVSITIRRVGSLRLEQSAFFGWHSDLATLSITDTENVHIAQIAFPAVSRFRRIRFSNITTLALETGSLWSVVGKLELENIRSLWLNLGAIRANIKTLDMFNVKIGSCLPQAISGSIGLVSLRSVSLSSAESRCLDAGYGWSGLALTDSLLDHLSPRSIYGTIANISISNCRIGSAGPAALSVAVTELSISNTSVGRLSPWSLQAEAAVSVTLRGVNVTHLQQDSLRGLQVTNGVEGIAVSGLTVRRAEPGSLRFAHGAPVTLTKLRLTGSCVCSTPSWATQLLLGPHGDDQDGVSSNTSDPLIVEEDPFGGREEGTSGNIDRRPSSDRLAEERDLLLQQIEAGLCTVGGGSISLADFTVRRCGDSADAGGLSGEPAAPLAGWWSYLGVVLSAALLLGGVALLVVVVARCRRRLKPQPDRLERLEITAAGTVRLCSADRPEAGGEQCGAGTSNNSDQEPEAVYSEVTDCPADVAGYRTDKNPPAWRSHRESVSGKSPGPRDCSCSPNGLHAVAAKAEWCSCKPVRLTDSEPVYTNVPGGEIGAKPPAESCPQYDAVREEPPEHHNTEVRNATNPTTRDV